MPYLIDASNLGGALGGARGARDTEAVVRYLMEWARGRGRVIALFDGAERGRLAARYGGLEIAWSGAGRTADDEIVRRVAAAGDRGRSRDWIVVTNDRELARRCRDDGARVEGAESLVERIERPAPKSGARRARGAGEAREKPAANAEEREHWRKVFGGGE